jgi:lipopolysaccharide assembly protein A
LTDTIIGMNKLLWLLKWILKAAIFFTLFAFALNNQQAVTLHFFFGYQWQTPMVLLVLAIFALGLAFGFWAMGWTLRGRKRRKPAALDLPKNNGI